MLSALQDNIITSRLVPELTVKNALIVGLIGTGVYAYLEPFIVGSYLLYGYSYAEMWAKRIGKLLGPTEIRLSQISFLNTGTIWKLDYRSKNDNVKPNCLMNNQNENYTLSNASILSASLKITSSMKTETIYDSVNFDQLPINIMVVGNTIDKNLIGYYLGDIHQSQLLDTDTYVLEIMDENFQTHTFNDNILGQIEKESIISVPKLSDH